MFNYKKRLSLAFLIALTVFTSSVEASVPDAPGAYVGAYKSPNLATNTSSVKLSFDDNSNNEDGFYVSVYDYPAHNLFTTIDVDASNNAYQYANITGLTCNQTYQAVVVAYNDEGNSTESDLATFNMESTFGATCNDEVPDRPGPYIGISDINKSAVRVNFDDNSNNETGFRVFDGENINVTLPANDESSDINVYTTLTGLTCDKLYTIKAVAFNLHGDSLPSDERDFNISSTFEVNCDDMLQAPVADAGEDKQVEVDTVINIVGTGTDSDGTIDSYEWKEGSTVLATTASFDYIATLNGNHTLTLTVIDNDGLIHTDSMIVTVAGVGSVSGIISDALNGNSLASITLNIREGEDIRVGTILQTLTSNIDGTYLISELTEGSYTIEAIKNGYITGYFTIQVIANQINNNQNYALSPSLNEDEIRIVLTWGLNPSDLDSHLLGYNANADSFHLYYAHPNDSGSVLDHDDITSYGPETITITQQYPGTYSYYVYNYSRGSSLALSQSNAKIDVYQGNSLVRTYNVPLNQEGYYWNVFELDDNQITEINTVTNVRE